MWVAQCCLRAPQQLGRATWHECACALAGGRRKSGALFSELGVVMVLHPAALASVPFGVVLVRVRVRSQVPSCWENFSRRASEGCDRPTSERLRRKSAPSQHQAQTTGHLPCAATPRAHTHTHATRLDQAAEAPANSTAPPTAPFPDAQALMYGTFCVPRRCKLVVGK